MGRPVAFHLKGGIFIVSNQSEEHNKTDNQMGIFQSSVAFDRETISVSDGVKYEGYWATKPDQSEPFPFPVGSDTPWPGKKEFLTKLRAKQETAKELACRGMSHCRLIGQHGCNPEPDPDYPDYPIDYVNNGYREYKIVAANGDVIHWPEGYEHYIQVHNVKPSKEFYNFIMN